MTKCYILKSLFHFSLVYLMSCLHYCRLFKLSYFLWSVCFFWYGSHDWLVLFFSTLVLLSVICVFYCLLCWVLCSDMFFRLINDPYPYWLILFFSTARVIGSLCLVRCDRRVSLWPRTVTWSPWRWQTSPFSTNVTKQVSRKNSNTPIHNTIEILLSVFGHEMKALLPADVFTIHE